MFFPRGLGLMLWAISLTIPASIAAAGAAEGPGPSSGPSTAVRGQRVGTFPAETRKTYTTADGLPDDDVLCLAADGSGTVCAATASGLARFHDGKWIPVSGYPSPIGRIATGTTGLIGVGPDGLFRAAGDKISSLARLPRPTARPGVHWSLASGATVWLGTTDGLFQLSSGRLAPVEPLNHLLASDRNVRQVAVARDGRVAVAAAAGLFELSLSAGWRAVYPRQAARSWAPRDVRGVVFDRRGRLWFASPQGVGMRAAEGWKLWTGHEGLPYNDFTTIAAGQDGAVWLGTKRGAIRFDGQQWHYRAAPRWLPDNLVRDIVVTGDGTAWFATAAGVGVIERRPITLAEKAKFFEDEIDKRHRRTPYGFVMSVRLQQAGDKSQWTQQDSDNDGLWTAMYGAGECFAYAATGSAVARRRATAAFEALRFLSQVTQGGLHPAPQGFPARTVLPTSGPNPNRTQYTPERDRQRQRSDPLWKVIVPRWPTSADGKWFWKCDTSSDELDGHYFLYAVYYDLVAKTEPEKQRVRDVVVAITDHLITHDFSLIDHDGKPTRWARFSPADLNGDVLHGGRGLNSLSILSYLRVAEHMTGDPKYHKAYDLLVEKHSYATNALNPKWQNGPGTGNQSDDEMAFMCYYNLLRYETDPRRRRQYRWSLRWYWLLEQPERCPLLNLIFAALDDGAPMPELDCPPAPSYLADAVDTLRRIPLDRVMWSYENSHRLDVVKMPRTRYRSQPGGHLINGQVIPVDERGLEYWNQDPWQMDARHDGKTLADGAAFLLPYYLGRYHNLILP